ncbi:hypothetical protein BKA58DRAFT_74440 [Alternaria rosae]|uniref:uncharacterized protein n=1 Tax=Alternaria rosae TaxID=1187941 RepID=UPI001E8D7D57|nr:uncharacterized protein BKA58DRAFT_74440 [Alternaria rosae]KAH6877450.1 hypothetical protein BKA58DRAFT_74440 [Alternaria rosae]
MAGKNKGKNKGKGKEVQTGQASSSRNQGSSSRETPPRQQEDQHPPATPGLSLGFQSLDLQVKTSGRSSASPPSTRARAITKEDTLAIAQAPYIDAKNFVLALAKSHNIKELDIDEQVKSLVTCMEHQDPKQQKVLLDTFMVNSSILFDQLTDVILGVSNMAKELPDLMSEYGGVEGFHNQYYVLAKVKDAKEKRIQEHSSAVKAINTLQPGLMDFISRFSSKVAYNHQAMMDVAFCLRRMDVQDVALFLVQAAALRIQAINRSNDTNILSQDWSTVRNWMKDIVDYALTNTYSDKPIGSPQAVAALRADFNKCKMEKKNLQWTSNANPPILFARKHMLDGKDNN